MDTLGRLFTGKHARYVAVGIVVLAVIGLVLIVFLPQIQAGCYHYPVFNHARPDIVIDKQLFDIVNESRRTVMQIVFGVFGGALGGLVALYFTWKRTEAQSLQAEVAEQGHFTDRFTRAIEQLGAVRDDGKPKIEVRLGAIYALERLARDSERDHQTIVEILCAYIRENAKWPPTSLTSGERPPLRTDIQAVLTVIGRRERSEQREKTSGDKRLLDLRDTDLRSANLDSAHFEGANFVRAHLEGAYLGDAYLEGAILNRADLHGANLGGTHLVGASLIQCSLDGAALAVPKPSVTNSGGADLRTFTIVNYPSGPNQISLEQVKSTVGWQWAFWSPEARVDLGLPAPPNAGE